MHVHGLFAGLTVLASVATTQAPVVVKDIDQQRMENRSSDPSEFAVLGNHPYFAGTGRAVR